MTKVLQLLGPSTGGIRRHVASLTVALRSRGWTVAVAGPAGVLDGLGVDLDFVVAVPAGPGMSAWRQARRALLDIAPRADVVHAHGLKAGALALFALAGLGSRRPVLVLTVHNVVLDGTGGRAAPLLRRLERRLAGRADAVIATSAAVAARVGGGRGLGAEGSGRVRVVAPVGPPPVVSRAPAIVREQLGIAPGRPLVVAAGRLHPQKGFASLIDAAALLARRRPAAVVVVVGEGPEEAALREQVTHLGLHDVVKLAGPSPNAADELAAADAVAVPSVWESGPLVAAEALALGRPLVATPVGFVPDLVIDGETGRLVPVGDPGAMAAALIDVLDDPAAAAAMGEAGRRRVAERLDPGRLVDAIEDTYRAVLDGRR